MELDEFAELSSGTPLSEREKTLLADMKTMADLHKFDIVIVGGNHSPMRAVDLLMGLPRMVEPRGINKSRQRLQDMAYSALELKILGARPDICIFDDVDELHIHAAGRGSAKSMIVAEYLYKMAYPPRVGADQVKGPKGPRGKWGKLP